MARRRKKKDMPNIFSASVIDIFASSLGLFILIVAVLLPYIGKKSQLEAPPISAEKAQALSDLVATLEEQLKEKNESSDEKTKSLNAQVQAQQQYADSLKEQNAQLRQMIERLNREKRALKAQQKTKSPQPKRKKATPAAPLPGSFLALIVRWESQSHDVDLVVVDPQGTRFDFNNRKHRGRSGELILDTRSGPGVEVWQSPKVLSGTYKVKFIFYGQYNNKKPVEIKGTILTKKGRREIKPVTLKTAKQESRWIQVQVDTEGLIRRVL